MSPGWRGWRWVLGGGWGGCRRLVYGLAVAEEG